MKIQDAFAAYLLAIRADGVSKQTTKWYTSVLKSHIAYLGGQSLIGEITTNSIRGYIVSLQNRDARYINAKQKPKQAGGLSSASIRSHVTALHAFWAWVSREYDIKSPMLNIKRHKQIRPLPKGIDTKSFVMLLESTGGDSQGVRDKAILLFLADTGCRVGGLVSLKMENLFLEERRAFVVEKGEQRRMVFFSGYTARVLQRWIIERSSQHENVFLSVTTLRPLTTSGVHQLLKRLKYRTGATGRVNPHAFRHGFARHFIQAGGDISTLARLLGHADINTTAAYYAVFDQDELAAMHERFTPLNEII